MDKNRIAQQIITQLPYVDDVIIQRSPPDTLIIQVTESSPAAVIRSGTEYFLMDTRCKLLERGDASLAQDRAEVLGLEPLAPAVGTRLAVDQEQQAKLDSLKSLLDAIRARQMTGSLTGFIDLTAANEIRFGYGQDLTIIVPMNADFQEKTFQLKRVLETMDQRGVERQGTLDLTYGDGEAHLLPQRWLPEGTAEEEQSQAESSQTAESAARLRAPPSPRLIHKEKRMNKRRKSKGEVAVVVVVRRGGLSGGHSAQERQAQHRRGQHQCQPAGDPAEPLQRGAG